MLGDFHGVAYAMGDSGRVHDGLGFAFERWLKEKLLRQALIQKITTVGSQSLQFFIDLALTYGYRITIEELRSHTVMSNVLAGFVNGSGWQHYWRVNVFTGGGGQVTWHDAMGTAEESLAWWGDSVVECVIKQYAPAHTQVLFGYFTEEGSE